MDDLRAAARSLFTTPGPALVVIATLAIAIGANTAIFSVVNGVLLRPLGYGDDSQLLALWSTTESAGDDTFRLSPADYMDVRNDAAGLGGLVALSRYIGSTLTAMEPPARVGTMRVTPELFRVLAATPAAGSFFDPDSSSGAMPNRTVLTHGSWTNRFGADPALVGSSIEIDGSPYQVVGITQPGFTFPPGDTEVEMYFPMVLNSSVLPDRDHRMFDAIARLDDGVTLAAAQAELDALASQLAREFPRTNAGWGLTLRPLRQELLGNLTTTLWVLAGAVFLVLLTACVNIANVLIARSTTIGREFAVRAALGARPRDLCRRSLAESAILGALGGGAGVLLAVWGTSLLRAVLPAAIPRGDAISLDATVLAVAAALSLGATALFGVVPALRSMAPDLHELLKPAGASGGGAGGGRRMRELMVVLEVALAIVLLVGAGLLVRSFVRLSEVDPGFRREGVVSIGVQLPGSRYARTQLQPFLEQLVEQTKNLPGVAAAGAVSDLPMSSVGLGLELEFTVPGLDATVSETARPNADFRLVLPGYFEAIGMSIVQGRDFDSLDASSGNAIAIVNQTVVDRYFRDIDPVGQTLDVVGAGELEIVGVIADIHHSGLLSKYESEIYVPFGRIATRDMHLVVQSDLETASVARAIGDVLARLDPEIAPSQVVAISDLLWESVAQPRFNTALLIGLALCAALLAVVGTYGIVTYSVAERTTEIGVRMALGADSSTTQAMIVRQALGIVIGGAALGLVGAFVATRFLGQLLFEIEPTDPLTYGAVVVAAVIVAILAAWVPARRATRIDPVVALRDG